MVVTSEALNDPNYPEPLHFRYFYCLLYLHTERR